MEERYDLVYDVGLFDGEDTAYYLFRGYNVIAVDANPLMIERARLRFANEILAKRLTLLNLGISKTPGEAVFWISDVPEWSSFDRSIASRNGTPHRSAVVPTVPFAEVLARHGVPHYLKIDIEGNDRLCLEDLSGITLPDYISVESECVGDSTVLSDKEAIAMLELLRSVGYRRFKLVNQAFEWAPVRSSVTERLWMRVLTSAARGRLRVRLLSGIAERFTDSGRIKSLGFGFRSGCSGPWGNDIPGGWMTFDRARSAYLRERRLYFCQKRPLHSFWYDWHATY